VAPASSIAARAGEAATTATATAPADRAGTGSAAPSPLPCRLPRVVGTAAEYAAEYAAEAAPMLLLRESQAMRSAAASPQTPAAGGSLDGRGCAQDTDDRHSPPGGEVDAAPVASEGAALPPPPADVQAPIHAPPSGSDNNASADTPAHASSAADAASVTREDGSSVAGDHRRADSGQLAALGSSLRWQALDATGGSLRSAGTAAEGAVSDVVDVDQLFLAFQAPMA
jgi:hypothetical protein